MKTIDLTTPENAISYLKGLPEQVVTIKDASTEPTDAITDAVAGVVEESAHTWANMNNQWEWTLSELIRRLEQEIAAAI